MLLGAWSEVLMVKMGVDALGVLHKHKHPFRFAL